MKKTQPKSYPYSDDDMIYDYDSHRYVLTERYVSRSLGENLDMILNAAGDANPSTLASRFLRRVSNAVYGYIYKDNPNVERIEYYLAKHAPLRPWIKDMLEEQTLYMLMNGDIGIMSGLNISKGQAMELYKLRGAVCVAPEVEEMCNRIMPAFGHCLKYRGVITFPPFPQSEYRMGY